MRLSLVVTAVSVLGLAACTSAPKAPATPVQANQAAATTNDATATTPDSSQDTPKPKRKYTTTGSRLQTESPDPSVGAPPAGGLNNSSTNAATGGPK